jgi:hypothetical protein
MKPLYWVGQRLYRSAQGPGGVGDGGRHMISDNARIELTHPLLQLLHPGQVVSISLLPFDLPVLRWFAPLLPQHNQAPTSRRAWRRSHLLFNCTLISAHHSLLPITSNLIAPSRLPPKDYQVHRREREREQGLDEREEIQRSTHNTCSSAARRARRRRAWTGICPLRRCRRGRGWG